MPCLIKINWFFPDECSGDCPPTEIGILTCVEETTKPYGPWGWFGTQAKSCVCADLTGIAPVGRGGFTTVPVVPPRPRPMPPPAPPAPSPLPRPPNEFDRQFLDLVFPGGTPADVTVTDDATVGAGNESYNCIGWSLCSRTYRQVWLPPELDKPLVSFSDKIAGFDRLYQGRGWRLTTSCAPQPGRRKIALYCDEKGPTHAAKQIEGDLWESKCGQGPRVIHRGTGALEGGGYGRVCRCYEKSLNDLLRDERALLDMLRQAQARGVDRDIAKAIAEAEKLVQDIERAITVEGSS